MENKTVPPVVHHESMDNRTEWVNPAIVDYHIEEVTRLTFAGIGSDGVSLYS